MRWLWWQACMWQLLATFCRLHAAGVDESTSSSTTTTTSTSSAPLILQTGDKNICLPLVINQIQNMDDLITLPRMEEQLRIPKSLTHWLRFKDWQDFVQLVNSYELKDGEKSVMVRLMGGVGVGRFLSQMGSKGSASTTSSMKRKRVGGKSKENQHKRRKEPHSPHSHDSRLRYYNVTFEGRPGVMTIHKDAYIDKGVIDKAMSQLNKKVTLVHIEGANWGTLSEIIPARTMPHVDRSLTYRLLKENADHDSLRHFLHHEKLVAYVVNGAVSDELGMHPKVIPLPLGVSVEQSDNLYDAMRTLGSQPQGVEKKTLLLINTNPTRTRAPLIEFLRQNINPNHIDIGYSKGLSPLLLYSRIAEAKFVFCPSGLGFDTFRLWETLLLGSIPIVEANEAGMGRAYGSLPVLVVRDFRDVTEQMLQEAYVCFQKHAGRGDYLYRHLSLKHWVEAVRGAERTGAVAVEQFNAEHPGVNRYCDFIHHAKTSKTL